jgi:hypothetical protein
MRAMRKSVAPCRNQIALIFLAFVRNLSCSLPSQCETIRIPGIELSPMYLAFVQRGQYAKAAKQFQHRDGHGKSPCSSTVLARQKFPFRFLVRFAEAQIIDLHQTRF